MNPNSIAALIPFLVYLPLALLGFGIVEFLILYGWRDIKHRRELWQTLSMLAISLFIGVSATPLVIKLNDALFSVHLFKIDLTLQVIGSFILTDFLLFAVHKLQHHYQLGWEEHKAHHSSKFLSGLSSLRQNPFRLIFLQSFIPFMILPLLGLHPVINFLTWSLLMFWDYLLHTRWFRLPHFFSCLIITPAHHHVHHAFGNNFDRKNFGTFFSIWDRMSGSFHPPIPNATYGLGGEFQLKQTWQGFFGAIHLILLRIFRRFA